MKNKIYLVFGIFGLITLASYISVRFIFLLLPSLSWLDKTMAILLIMAELHLALHSLGFMIYILNKKRGIIKKRRSAHINFDNPPKVAIIVAARHEPKHILEETFTSLHCVDYKNKEIYLLDDSSQKKFKTEADLIAKKYGAKVFRRKSRHGAKAGIINDFIKKIDAPYIAIFDADQNPMPDFLKRVIPIIHADDKLAFIQTPQVYTNINVSQIAKASAMQQTIFYESMCEGKEFGEAMFCCGTNVVFKKEALSEIGGFEENSVTEDFATSVKLHLEGYKSCYYNHATAFGMAPESLPAYFKQQARWAAGDAQVLRTLLRLWFTHPVKAFKSMTLFQWWEYFLSSTFYFVGWSFFILMITPAIYLILNVPSFFLWPEIYFATFVPYFGIFTLAFYSTMMDRHYRLKEIYRGVILSFLAFPVYIKGTFSGLLNRKMRFQITQKGKGEVFSQIALWPYYSIIFIYLLALFFGFLKIGENIYAISINIFWITYHLFILLHIFSLNTASNFDNEWYTATKRT